MATKPLKFRNIEELEKKINLYFEYCDNFTKTIYEDGEEKIISAPKPYTVTGLALYLGMSKDTLINYHGKAGYKDIIERAKLRIHAYAEEQLFTNNRQAAMIFNLKNNWGWKDKTEQEVDLNNTIQVIPPSFD